VEDHKRSHFDYLVDPGHCLIFYLSSKVYVPRRTVLLLLLA
jgi:hypothetical protein